MKIPPPGLPFPIVDELTQPSIPTPQSTWDVLAETAIKGDYSVYTYHSRLRVRWVKYFLFRWCCGSRMRHGVVDEQPKTATFGWSRINKGFAACRHCGRMNDVY